MEIFYKTPSNHLSGQNCPKCCKNLKYSIKKFIEKANEIHSNKYSYSLTKYTYGSVFCSHGKMRIRCNDCGNAKI